MDILESIGSGLASIWSHKLRSALTLFGIIVGVAAVVAMTSFVGGIAGRIWEDFDKLGLDNVLFVANMRPMNPEGYAYLKASKGLSFEDTEILRAEVDEILGITPVVADYRVVRAGSEARRAEIFAATPDGFFLLKFILGQGRFLSDLDVENNARVAVLGEIVKEDLFGEADAVGENILIGDEHFHVVGVLRQKDFSDMFGGGGNEQREEHERVYIPITAGMHYISGTKRIAYFAVRLKKDADLATGYDKIHNTLLREHRQIEDFQIENVAEEILQARQQVQEIVNTWNGILSTIATVSLLVGGIGLLSVLIISVNERLREIGIRKAVGAENRAVFQQFLIESVTISVFGGLVGVGVGVGLTKLMSFGAQAMGQDIVIPVSGGGILLGLSFAIIVGVVFGLYPAIKASKLDPIEAISKHA